MAKLGSLRNGGMMKKICMKKEMIAYPIFSKIFLTTELSKKMEAIFSMFDRVFSPKYPWVNG